MSEEDFDFTPTDWTDPDEAGYVLDLAEESFAEARYLEDPPPAVRTFIDSYTRAIPSLDEPEWPSWAKRELADRCLLALLRIVARDETYEHYRNIYTEEDREAARERRRTAREAAGRWSRSDFGDHDAFDVMVEAIEAEHAEKRQA